MSRVRRKRSRETRDARQAAEPHIDLDRSDADAASALVEGLGMSRVEAVMLVSRWHGRPPPSDHRAIMRRVRPRPPGWVTDSGARPTARPQRRGDASGEGTVLP